MRVSAVAKRYNERAVFEKRDDVNSMMFHVEVSPQSAVPKNLRRI